MVDPNGIEVFNTKEGPPGSPRPAEFPLGTKTKQPLLDVDATHNAVSNLLTLHPDSFGSPSAATAAWDVWKATHPRSVSDVARDRLPAWDFPSK